MNRPRTVDAARGKWRGILLELGVPAVALTGPRKHGACPFPDCGGGRDRFRWDDKDGSGSYICNVCGAGTAFDMLQRLFGWDFPTAAREVDRVMGKVPADPPRPPADPVAQLKRIRALWGQGRPIEAGDPVSLYFEHRGLTLPSADLDCIRFHPSCPVPREAGQRLAMLAKVVGPDGAGVNVHCTFLTPQGRKAEMDDPRALRPGCIPDGSAIRLAPVAEVMGIAEGIETARKAEARFGVPTWSAINTTILAKWRPPPEVKKVLVFGDNDRLFGGVAAAGPLAHHLAARMRLQVELHIPPEVGTDWADAA